jgi:hypothetical protein
MARGLFISETFVKENSEIDENVDMKLINPTIWYCQKEYLEKTLGTVLYNDLISKIVASTLAGDDLTLVDDYIADCLLFWVKHELQVPLTYKFRNKSVSTNTDPNSQPVSFDIHKYLRDYYKPKAQYFTERLEKYLCANEALFPLYCTEDSIDELSPRKTPPQSAFYLGKSEPLRDSYGYIIEQ